MAGLKIGLVVDCASAEEWEAWLAANHDSATEAWLRLAKKGSGAVTVTREDALETALTYGWIDGQSASQDETYWLQRFTPRTRRSKWSEINREAVEQLTAAGRMKPAGLAAVEAAKDDGRWHGAYAPASTIEVPEDLLARLKQNRAALAFFEQLNGRNRYAILYRIADAKKAETRARRIDKFVGMLERGETIH
ncbi:YdeI family protein [soil metagenome]